MQASHWTLEQGGRDLTGGTANIRQGENPVGISSSRGAGQSLRGRGTPPLAFCEWAPLSARMPYRVELSTAGSVVSEAAGHAPAPSLTAYLLVSPPALAYPPVSQHCRLSM